MFSFPCFHSSESAWNYAAVYHVIPRVRWVRKPQCLCKEEQVWDRISACVVTGTGKSWVSNGRTPGGGLKEVMNPCESFQSIFHFNSNDANVLFSEPDLIKVQSDSPISSVSQLSAIFSQSPPTTWTWTNDEFSSGTGDLGRFSQP